MFCQHEKMELQMKIILAITGIDYSKNSDKVIDALQKE
tara:strand:+ start:821 stop:934 length:114 start_codon:yes stop_codon:yes gene_type:complete